MEEAAAAAATRRERPQEINAGTAQPDKGEGRRHRVGSHELPVLKKPKALIPC